MRRMPEEPELLVPLSEARPAQPPAAPAPRSTWRTVVARLWFVLGALCIAPSAFYAVAGPERGVMLQITLAIAFVWLVVPWILRPLSSRGVRR